MKLIIKPEFDEKLKKLRVKTRFLNNLKGQHYNPEISLQLLNKCRSFSGFVILAFSWYKTPEGNDYWYIISKK